MSDTGWLVIAGLFAPLVIIVLVAMLKGYHFMFKAWKPITRHTETVDAEPTDHNE